jgi:hypothetical protein
MSADVKKATENAVANNQPATFQNLASSTVVPQENFSSKNVNPEYLSRYGQLNTASGEDVVYFEENQSATGTSTPDIDIYNTFRVSNFNSGWGNTGWGNSAFNFGYSPFGMGIMGMSPFGMGMMGMSPFGMGMYEYYQKNRMHRAKDLILTRKHSVTAVGTMLGYQNLSNFSNAFKKEFNFLPSEVLSLM